MNIEGWFIVNSEIISVLRSWISEIWLYTYLADYMKKYVKYVVAPEKADGRINNTGDNRWEDSADMAFIEAG